VRLRHAASIVVSVFMLAACHEKSVAERIAEHDRTRVSWKETARFVGEEWIDSAVPSEFAMRALSRARQELSNESASLDRELFPTDTLARLRASLASAKAFTDTLDREIGSLDRVSARRTLERVPRERAPMLSRASEPR
jgi:hypothetical protein